MDPRAAEHGASPLDSVLQDLRYTFRTLRRDAGFTTFAILIVALGVGASSTVFSVANALLIRPLPFSDPGRLVPARAPCVANRSNDSASIQLSSTLSTTRLGRDIRACLTNLVLLRKPERTFAFLFRVFVFSWRIEFVR